MRHLIQFLLVTAGMAVQFTSHAQTFVNVSLGGNFGNYSGIQASLDVTLQNRMTFSLIAGEDYIKARELPADYDPGIDLFGWGNPTPRDYVDFYGVMMGYALNGGSHARINLRGGIAMNQVKTSDFTPRPPDVWGIGSNYNYNIKKSSSVGLLLAPRIEVLPTRFFGIALGAFANINPDCSVYGFSAEMLLGYLREKK